MKFRSKITWSSLAEKHPVVKEWSTVPVDSIVLIKLWDANIYLITDDDRVYACGTKNYDGTLGLEHVDCVAQPTEIKQLAKQQVVDIVCGQHQVFALTATGKLWAWGELNSFLGLKLFCSKELALQPQLVFAEVDCTKVVIGKVFALFLTNEGTVYACGKDRLGSQKEWGQPSLTEIHMQVPEKIVDLSCGFEHALLLSDTGLVYGFGNNKRHSLGECSGLPKIAEPMVITLPDKLRAKWIACGPSLSTIITVDGRMWLVGGEIKDFSSIALPADFLPSNLFIVSYKYFMGGGDDCLLFAMDREQQQWAIVTSEDYRRKFCVSRVVSAGLSLAEMVLLEAKLKAMPIMVKIIKPN